jgi:hypothetical protein
VTDHNHTVVVTSDATLPEIIDRLRAASAGGHTVNLVIPIDSSLLLTTREFQALKVAVDDGRLAVSIRTADPLRLQLAQRLGMPVQAMPRPRVVPPVRLVAAPVQPFPDSGRETPPPDDGKTESGDTPGERWSVRAPSRPAPETLWPGQNGAHGAVVAEPDASEAESGDAAPRSENPPRRWLPVAAALVLLVGAAFLAIRFMLPEAVVRIVPKTAPVAASLRFDVTTDGQPLHDGAAFTLMAEPRNVDVVWTGSAPVTGVRKEPDATASGPIELRNLSPEPIVVDQGTEVKTETGVSFVFAEAVTVPASDQATGRPGAATGTVRAVQGGSGGNVGTGEIGGRLPNGVYYSNRMQPTGGGTDKEFPVVAQADLDALHAAAATAAPDLVAAAIDQQQPGTAILPTTVQITGQQDTFDHNVGEDAGNVTLEATLTIQVLTYDGQAANERSQETLSTDVTEQAPQGFAVEPTAIAYEQPVVIEENDRGTRVEVAAHTDAVAELDEAEQTKLAAALAGADPDQAAAILRQWPEIASYSVDYHPSWLPPQMPHNANRIQFQIVP